MTKYVLNCLAGLSLIGCGASDREVTERMDQLERRFSCTAAYFYEMRTFAEDMRRKAGANQLTWDGGPGPIFGQLFQLNEKIYRDCPLPVLAACGAVRPPASIFQSGAGRRLDGPLTVFGVRASARTLGGGTVMSSRITIDLDLTLFRRASDCFIERLP